MKRVKCKVEQIEMETESGSVIPGVRATCTKCDHTTESFGTGEASIKRCLVLMREECEEGEENFYVDEDE